VTCATPSPRSSAGRAAASGAAGRSGRRAGAVDPAVAGPAVAGPAVAGPAGPNAAPTARRVLAQIRFETAAVLRNGEQLLLIAILPAFLLVGLTRSELVSLGEDAARIDVAAPGVLALAVMSTAFTSQAIATAFDRRAGVLRLLATTPLGRGGLLAGKVGAVLAVVTGQLAGLGALALALGWSPDWSGVPVALLGVVLGTGAFTALALLMAGTMRAEAVLAGANLIWLLLLTAGGVVIPPDRLPRALGGIAALLPSGALAEVLRSALGAGDGGTALPLLVLLAWATALGLAARRLFRWA
jgi:ABC-2 type transport system permease protein